ncbi:SusC/RagA family TonB-linked outer membrane protein [Sphingobacterium oryzagri]|uniref:SusC/RagA family TonB-linked outer membrane protein n=1 Tax=Sphingobacterium oryzagri TaxID=3025669 RepID=A0ABY7WIQ8_9SPHI|nr:SusC/RagA family TonB-linked outer membrane protein [Sphingobacterium sp. KACC 22765]WDF69068.1 SusC/RagA family TonB-linked outer membrane protein [Sphingobacterium sp. KACC 22765]
MNFKTIYKNKLLWRSVGMLCTFLIFLPLAGVFGSNRSVYASIARNTLFINITGKILDAGGKPVIGATVVIKGTNTSTQTDEAGVFRLNAPPGSEILVISYVGFKTQEVAINGRTAVDVKLETTDAIDEVVVVGYGTQKKEHLTGAIQTIKSEEIQDIPVTNVGAALRGRLVGVGVSGGINRPGQPATINIRNAYTVSKDGGTTQPLYVIDGVIQVTSQGVPDNTFFNSLVPSEIETITFVKDAAAAVYGSRGANGVVIVTTKRGQSGEPRISYSGSFALNDESYRPKMLSAYDFGRYMNIMNGPYGAALPNEENNFFSADELEHFKTIDHDWLDAAWSPSHLTQHALNASGGTEKATYFAGVSYQEQNGNLSTVDYSRWNFRAGADVKVSNSLKAGIQVSGNYANNIKTYNKISGENDDNDYRTLVSKPRYVPMYVDGYPVRGPGANDLSQYHFFEIEKYNNTSNRKGQAMTVNFFAEYQVPYVEGLSARFTYGRNFESSNTQRIGGRYDLYTFDMLGENNHIYDGAEMIGSVNVKNDDRISFINTNGRSEQMNFNLNYNRTFGKHEFTGLFSVERAESESGQENVMRDQPLQNNNGQFNTAFGEVSGTTFAYESGSLGYIGRLNYAYDDKYLVELLYRSDASTRFAPENYWGNFYSTSVGWVLSRENFFKADWVNFLKVRYSYGKLGTDDTRAWNWRQRYTFQNGKGAVFGGNDPASTGLRMEASPNRNARWSDHFKQNFGVDANFLNNRLSVNADGYYNRGRNLLMELTANVPVSVGGTIASENFGAIDTYGIELTTGWNDQIGKDFRYGINLRFSWSDNKVLKGNFNEQDILLPWNPQPGKSSDNGMWGLDYLGMFRNQQEIDAYVNTYNIQEVYGVRAENLQPGMLYYRDVRGTLQADGTFSGPDGIIDDNDQILLGKRRDSHFGLGTTINLGYKGINLSMVISGSFGGWAEHDSNARKKLNNNINRVFENMPAFWSDIYDPELNPGGQYPNPHWEDINLSPTSTFWQVNSFRMAMQSATLSYTLPTRITDYANISNARIVFSAMNPVTFYNPFNYRDAYTSFDVYPNLRTYSLGLNLTF